MDMDQCHRLEAYINRTTRFMCIDKLREDIKALIEKCIGSESSMAEEKQLPELFSEIKNR
jgi:hypothetical protein